MTTNKGQIPEASNSRTSPNSSIVERRLWPFTPRASLVWTFVLLVALSVVVATLRTTVGWPSDKSESVVLLAVLVLSLLPILLHVLDIVVDRGGVIQYAGVTIDFSQVHPMGASGITVPVNIGVRGQSVTDSSTTQILDALRQATASDLAVIDLEAGQAWWETRLLVLLAGAVRHRRPERIVFVGTEAGREQAFQGWAFADELLPQLARAHPQYVRSLERAAAAARQWELVEPINPMTAPPPLPPWMQPGLATQHPWMAFDYPTGLHNEFLTEQLLASDLGENVETKETPRSISLVRLDELFKPVLHKDSIDQSWPSDRQNSTFFETDALYFAVTQKGTYVMSISRMTVLNDMVRVLIGRTGSR